MKRNVKYLILILIMAVTAVYCITFFDGYVDVSDGNDYAGLARSIVRGEGFSQGHLYPLTFAFYSGVPQPDLLWAPVYPVYHAFWFYLFGVADSSLLISIIFSIWLFILAVFLFVRKFTGDNWALLAAAMVGTNQHILVTAIEGSPESLTGALLLFSIIPIVEKKSIGRITLSAILFGVTILSRYQIAILAVPLLIFFIGWDLKKIIYWCGFVLLTLSPWLLRNYIIFGNPVFTLQPYGEFTKGMGHLKHYYYTYRSLTPMTLWYALSNFPLYIIKKFIAGIIFFPWYTIKIFNFFGLIPLFWLALRFKKLDPSQKRIILFSLSCLVLMIVSLSLNGIHLRHLLNIYGLLTITVVIGLSIMRKEIKLFSNTLPFVILIAAVMFPVQFPKQEIGLKVYADEIKANKVIYEKLTTLTNKDDVIFSDASDAVWWYSDRYAIWIPVVYDDLKTIAQRESIDYIFLEKPSIYFDILTEDELVDFFTITEFVEGDPLGWGLYKINLNNQIKE